MTNEANGGKVQMSQKHVRPQRKGVSEWSGLFKGYTTWLEGSLSSIVREIET